jgi:hypothetical protein
LPAYERLLSAIGHGVERSLPMRQSTAAALLALTLALAACSPQEEESVEERFRRTEAAIENTAADIEATTENAVRETESRLDNEVDALENRAEAVDEAEANQTEANASR